MDFKVLWKPYHLRSKLVTPMMWVKAKSGRCFSKITLAVTASNNKIKYQDHIILFDVNEVPIQVALPSIPFRSLKFEGNTVFTPYDTIRVEVKALYDIQGAEICAHPKWGRNVYPFDRLEVAMGLEKGDVEKWGEVFNLSFIEMAIKEKRMSLIGSKLEKLKLFYLLRKRLLSINWVVKTIFWSKNIFTAKQLMSKLVEYLEEYDKQKSWEQENQRKNDTQ